MAALAFSFYPRLQEGGGERGAMRRPLALDHDRLERPRPELPLAALGPTRRGMVVSYGVLF